MSDKTLLLRIKGRVQGVGFRYWTEGEASRRGLRGWVRNRADGSVEALVTGEENAVDAMVAACRNGPRLAQVVSVEAKAADDDGSAGFHHRPTG